MANLSIAPKIIAEEACVVYDTANGDILHVHHSTTYEGGKPPDSASLRAETLDLFRQHFFGRKRKAVETLVFDPAAFAGGAKFKINVKTKKPVSR